MTREELRRRMSSAEFAEWMALYRIEAYERDKAAKDARARAKARGMAQSMRAGG